MSHLSGINKGDLKKFRRSCLGSGPIIGTIKKLRETQYTDLDIWGLYIWELDKYVHVESISGVPYRKIKNIGVVTSVGSESYFSDFRMVCSKTALRTDEQKDFTNRIAALLLENKVFKYSYQDGHYTLGMPFVTAVFNASNTFIEYYNSHPELRKRYKKEKLFGREVLSTLVFSGDAFYAKDSRNLPIEAVVNTEMFTFKGDTVCLTFKDYNAKYDSGEVTIINIELLSLIVYNILKYINVKYGRKEDNVIEKARIV